jgi:membrane-associated protein
MPFFATAVDVVLHLDRHLDAFIGSYGLWMYLILFLVIFFETGLVVMPFLPGDSLLFAAGAFAAVDSLEVSVLFMLLTLAAILGDALNYWVGSFVGPRAFTKPNARFLKKKYLKRTHDFYEKHGKKTIILARFAPIVRTFAPFVAGIAKMQYHTFTFYNVIGAILWVGIFIFGGYFFGNLPFVKENFSLVIGIIIFISVTPMAIELWRARKDGDISHVV